MKSKKQGKPKKTMKPESGKILISAPFMNDFYFGRSVVLLADHNTDGSFGVILNKPLDVTFNEIVQDFPDFKADVFIGGPVKPENVFFMHTLGDKISNSIKVIEGLYWGGDIDEVKALITSGDIEPSQVRFFIGYSGWAPKQLERELKEHSWVVAGEKAKLLLDMVPGNMWKNLVKRLGEDYSEWVNYPIDPSLN